MKHALLAVVAMLVVAPVLSWSQQPNNPQRQSIRSELDKRLSAVEHELVPAVEAMPKEKFNFVPTTGEYKGVRTFAQQAKHVASSNFFYFAGFAPEKPPSSAGNLARQVFLASDENGPAT
jgi:hypothetical protein